MTRDEALQVQSLIDWIKQSSGLGITDLFGDPIVDTMKDVQLIVNSALGIVERTPYPWQ
jgi:hypothetical protein